MLLVPTFLARSAVNGVGLFAAAPIKRGAPVWMTHPAIDLPITSEQLASLPPLARQEALRHGFAIRETGVIILSRDAAVFVNHSENPNLGNDGRALRDIEWGHEIVEDYRLHGPGACRAFLDTK